MKVSLSQKDYSPYGFFQPHLSKGFGIRLGEAHRPKEATKSHLIR